jgi:hypothetical protein
MLRQILALVLTLAMALPAVVRSELVCAKHSHAESAGTMPGMAHHQSSTHHHDAKPPCEAPTGQPCCQAMVTCVQSLALNNMPRSVEPPLSGVNIAHALMAIPLSRFVAPEPPPPKA